MSNTNTGGPAFPSMRDMRHSPDFDHEEGMTLRDYLAAQAMQGLMARNWCDPKTGKAPDDIFDVWASSAYKAADAMLKARRQ